MGILGDLIQWPHSIINWSDSLYFYFLLSRCEGRSITYWDTRSCQWGDHDCNDDRDHSRDYMDNHDYSDSDHEWTKDFPLCKIFFIFFRDQQFPFWAFEFSFCSKLPSLFLCSSTNTHDNQQNRGRGKILGKVDYEWLRSKNRNFQNDDKKKCKRYWKKTLFLGKTSMKKKCLLSGIARMRGGGSTHARIFWPFFKKCIFGQ